VTDAVPAKNKGGRPRKGEEKPGIAKLDLVNGWLPAGILEDDTNREVCRTLFQTWRRLTERQQRGVILFEECPDYQQIAEKAGYGGKPNTAADKLKKDMETTIVQQVFRLRTILIGNTVPTVVSRRVLGQIIMGTYPGEVTINGLLRAIQINAQLAGELVPEIKPGELPADAVAGVTRDENDRIMAETTGRLGMADELRKRAKAAAEERKEAARVDVDDGKDEPEAEPAPLNKLAGMTPMERLVAAQKRQA